MPPPSFNSSSINSTDILNMTIITDPFNMTDIKTEYSQSVETAPVYLLCCALSLAAISAFLRAGFVLKFFAMICCIAIQGCLLNISELFVYYDRSYEPFWQCTVYLHIFLFIQCFSTAFNEISTFDLILFVCLHIIYQQPF